jgi:hypothetical protein
MWRSDSSLRAASTSRAPRLAAIRAVTKPMPLLAPVMTITWSLSFFNLYFIVFALH